MFFHVAYTFCSFTTNFTFPSSLKLLNDLAYNFRNIFLINCHNPTTNPKQFKTTFVGVVLLSVTPHHTTTAPGLITIWAVLDNLVQYATLSPDKIWKTTLFFFKWNTTSIIFLMEDNLNFLMEDDLNFYNCELMTSKENNTT
jgi:hypothetical protein